MSYPIILRRPTVPHRSQPLNKPSSVYPKRAAKRPLNCVYPTRPNGGTKRNAKSLTADALKPAGKFAIGNRSRRTIHLPVQVCRRAFLTGSGSQTEIAVTRSKQTAEEFLTGARTRVWRPFTLSISEGRCFSGIAHLISRGALLPGSAEYVECDVTHSKQSTDEFLPGA